MNERIEIHRSRKKAAVIVIVGVVFAVVGWVFLHFLFQNVIGWSMILLSALCFLFGIGTLADRKPYIVLTESGITDMTTVKEEIEWDAIRHVDEFYYRGLYFIRLLVDRGYKPSLVQPTWFYRLDRIYEREGVKAIFIRMGFLELNSMQLASLIRRFIQADARQRRELINGYAVGTFAKR